jgi:hypothetical protein
MSTESAGFEAAPSHPVSFFGLTVDKQNLGKIFFTTTSLFVLGNLALLPFALPGLRRFAGAPFVPSQPKSVQNLFQHFPRSLEGAYLIDLGSGDGRIVHAAARRGLAATGVELNPWLVALSRYRAWREGLTCTFVCGNIYSELPKLVSFSKAAVMANKRVIAGTQESEKQATLLASSSPVSPFVVVVYGLPSVNARIGELVDQVTREAQDPVYLVSNAFKVPGWGNREIGGVDSFVIYEKNANC